MAYVIPHKIKPARFRILPCICFKSFFGRAYRPGFKAADYFIIYDLHAVKFHLKHGAFRFKGTPGGGHTHPVKPDPDLFFKTAFNRAGNRRDLIDVFNLPVNHRPFGMFGLFYGNNIDFAVFNKAHHAYNASCPYIQSKNRILRRKRL